MDNTTLFVGSDDVQKLSRQALIYENAAMALMQTAKLERQLITQQKDAYYRSPPGLFDIIPDAGVIAVGMRAHTALADFKKCSLLAGEHRLDTEPQGDHEIERLIWSCANTSRAVAIGDQAWRALQMLPVADRRHYEVPPLKFPQSHAIAKAQNLLIINHDADDRLARHLAALAATDGFIPTCCGSGQNAQGFATPIPPEICRPEAGIHVHVGLHSVSAENFRLIDSWHCGRPAVQLLPARPPEGWEAGNLLAEDEANGFICHSAETVLQICKELQQDHVLGRKLVGAGHHSAAPLARIWSIIAQDLLLH